MTIATKPKRAAPIKITTVNTIVSPPKAILYYTGNEKYFNFLLLDSGKKYEWMRDSISRFNHLMKRY
ncbi:hypothetical protein KSD_71610 [Ktedonobacter sp. SOSP1-85]|nr:hypothetical protein KSD_71610 [Ktedonobacter sp. SOSP1-85]